MIQVAKTDWSGEWVAMDGGYVAFGNNPVQAVKRLRSPECIRWFDRHRKGKKYGVRIGRIGPDWEWCRIFYTISHHNHRRQFHGR